MANNRMPRTKKYHTVIADAKASELLELLTRNPPKSRTEARQRMAQAGIRTATVKETSKWLKRAGFGLQPGAVRLSSHGLEPLQNIISPVARERMAQLPKIFRENQGLFYLFARQFLQGGVPEQWLRDYCLNQSILGCSTYIPQHVSGAPFKQYVLEIWKNAMKTAAADYAKNRRIFPQLEHVPRPKEPRFPGPEQGSIKKEEWEKFRAAFDSLKPNEQLVIQHRFGLDGFEVMTLEKIGKKIGLTKERVRQLEENARQKLARRLRREFPLEILK